MNYFICSENSNYTSIINTCVVEGEVVIYEAKESKELCRIDEMPETILVVAADKINVYACTEAWRKENYEHRHKLFIFDNTIDVQPTQISKHDSICLQPTKNSILWKSPKHNNFDI